MHKGKWPAWRLPSLTYSPADMIKLLGVAALYVLLAITVHTFFLTKGVVSIVWPPSGLALAALLIGGNRYAVGVFLGAFLANTMTGHPLGVAAIIATGNTLEALLGAWLLKRDGKFDPNFRSLHDYLRLIVLAGFLGVSISALTGTTTLHVYAVLPTEDYFPNLRHWWMGDAIGILLITPFILLWRRVPKDWGEPQRVIETVLMLTLTFLVGQVIFIDWFHDTLGQVARGYWLYLLITLAAVRLGTHGVAAVLLMVATQALVGAAQGTGFFADDMAKTQLTNYWFYMVILFIIGMTLATYLNELQQATERLRTVLDNAADAVFVANPLGRCIYVNRQAATMLGYPSEELLTLAITDVAPTDGQSMTQTDLQQLLKDGSLRKEITLKCKDGRLVPVELSAVRLPDGNLYGACRDITENKAIAENLARLKHHNDLILNAAGEGICGVDTHGTIIFTNPAAAEMLGFSVAELFGRSLHDTTHHTRPDGIPYPAADCPILASLVSGHTCQEGDEFYYRRDGSRFPVEYTSTPIIDEGKIIGAVVMFSDITQRRQAEESLQRWRQFVEHAAWGMAIGDFDSRAISLANPAYARMHGYCAEDIIGVSAWTLYGPGSRPALPHLHEVLQRDGHLSFECERQRKDGSTFPALVDIALLYDAQGKAQGYIANVQDITARKQLEAALRESEELFRTLFGGIADAIFVHSVADDGALGHFIVVNDVACERLGYTREEMLSMTPLDIDAPDSGIDIAPAIKRIEAGESATFEQVHVARNGKRIPVELRVNPILLLGQKAVITLARDITERKQAEEMLRGSEERFRSTFEQAAVGMAHVAPNGAFLRLNQKFCEIAGYPHRELMSLTFQDITHPDDLEKDLGYAQQVLAGKIATYTMEKRYVRKDITLVWINLTVSLVRKTDGAPDYFIAVIEDITERKRMQQILRELPTHLQTVREEEKANIAREIHDELGSTLTALKMDVYWLTRLLPPEKISVPLLERVESLSSLLEDAVVATRRIISELRPTVLDDLGLLAALEWQCAQFHKRTGIECRVHGIKDDDRKVRLDSRQSINLFRIAQEALTNVSRHAGASWVEVEFFHGEDEILLSISDNGRGLPPNRAIPSTSYGMRGMSERAEYLGGTIKFDSPPGGGTTVTVKLHPPAGGKEKEKT